MILKNKVLSPVKVGSEEWPSVWVDPHLLNSELYEQTHGYMSAHIPVMQLFNWTGGGAWLWGEFRAIVMRREGSPLSCIWHWSPWITRWQTQQPPTGVWRLAPRGHGWRGWGGQEWGHQASCQLTEPTQQGRPEEGTHRGCPGARVVGHFTHDHPVTSSTSQLISWSPQPSGLSLHICLFTWVPSVL